jgi:hypothetical protein
MLGLYLDMILIHPHAKNRAVERGALEQEIIEVVETGEVFPAKYGRTGFRKTMIYNNTWQVKHFYIKQIECFAVKEQDDWLVISLLVKYF